MLTEYYMKKNAGLVDQLKAIFNKVKPQIRQHGKWIGLTKTKGANTRFGLRKVTR